MKRLSNLAFLALTFSMGVCMLQRTEYVYASESVSEEQNMNEYDKNSDPNFESDMKLYYQYVENHELKEYLDGRDGIFGDASSLELYVQKIKVADFDGDNRAEIWITGPSASANSIAGILDVLDGEVKCVFNGWGNEWGRYTDPETGKTGIVIEEGNSDGDGYTHTRVSLYDENWNNTVLTEAERNEAESKENLAEDNQQWDEIRRNCNKITAVKETETETNYMGKSDILEFLQKLIPTVSKEAAQTGLITGYPEYDEIIYQYYNGMAANWSIGEFSENNLCYLAGYYSETNQLGYCVMDINGDGIDDLMIGAVGDYSYYGMFFDLYTMIDSQRTLVISSGERDRYYLCQDHTIANEGSGSAEISVWGYYDFISGQLQLKESVFADGYENPENPWFYTTTAYGDYSTPISEEEGRNIINKYTYMDIPYTRMEELDIQAKDGNDEPQTMSYRQLAEQKVKETEQQVDAIEAEVNANSGLSEEEYEQILNEEYTLWDDSLNSVWSYLKEALSSEEMDNLTQEEMQWISDKEAAINSARNQSEKEALIQGINITKDRVYSLVDKLQ